MQVLLFGSNGVLGNGIADALSKSGHEVIATARSEQAAQAASAQGRKSITVDLTAASSVQAAAQGVDAAIVQIPSTLSDEASLAFADTVSEGLKHGPKRVVLLTAVVVPHTSVGVSRADARLKAVQMFKERIPHVTIVTATQFLENFSQGLRQAIEYGVLPYCVPADAPVAWLALEDYAASVAKIVANAGLSGQRIDLGGTEAITATELATVISAVLGRPVNYQFVPPEGFAAQLAPYVGDAVASQISDLVYWSTSAGAPIAMPDVRAVFPELGHQPMTVKAWAEKAFGQVG